MTETILDKFLLGDVDGQTDLTIQQDGKLGIDLDKPVAKAVVTGTVGFDGLTGATGAGSLCLDANKQVVYNSASDNCLSSTRATKHDINPLVWMRSRRCLRSNRSHSSIMMATIALASASLSSLGSAQILARTR